VPELSLLKKLEKWGLEWQKMAQKILDVLPKPNKNSFFKEQNVQNLPNSGTKMDIENIYNKRENSLCE
jgi:hypothetical protein